MRLLEISADGFRNLQQVRLVFGSPLTLLFGDNAQGKTSVLEAIYLLGTSKSFRDHRIEHLVSIDRDAASVAGEVRSGAVAHRLECALTPKEKRFRLDGREAGPSDYLSALPVVVLSAEDRSLVKGEPRHRRNFLDTAGVLRRPSYLKEVLEFGRCRAQRAALLRDPQSSRKERAAWTDPYAALGEKIQRERARLTETLNGLLDGLARDASAKERVHLVYRPSGGEDLRAALERASEAERRAGTNLVGPQRDRVEILLDGRALEAYGSAGQARRVLWMLKLSLVLLRSGGDPEPPLFLVDDAEAELDQRRIEELMRLTERRAQVVLTAVREWCGWNGELDRRRVAGGRVA
ncbi:MAG: DNA replication and repair protein RecF [Acidobacteriota bacterium]